MNAIRPNKLFLYFMLALSAALAVPAAAASSTRQTAPAVASQFVDYYNTHEGMRVLGLPLGELGAVGAYPAQYFEKGRIEDHRAEVDDPAWAFMYGRLTAELIEAGDPELRVSSTDITYAGLRQAAAPAHRVNPPTGFTGGTKGVFDGMFVPFDAHLRPARGYLVAPYFWAYINRAELFPGGWLHDVGLPLTNTTTAVVVKDGERRTVFLQAFERAVLTYDGRNPAGWQVEKGNIGADAFAHARAGTGAPAPVKQIAVAGTPVQFLASYTPPTAVREPARRTP